MSIAQTDPNKPVTYGYLLSKMRWTNILFQQCPRTGELSLYRRQDLWNERMRKGIEERHVASHQRTLFGKFSALPIELQMEVIEWLVCDDLKCFELINPGTKRLLTRRTKALDAALFRSPLSATPLEPNQELPCKLHPLLNWKTLNLQLLHRWIWVPFSIPANPGITGGRLEEHRSKNLVECTENACEPPCASVRIALWGDDWVAYVQNHISWNAHVFGHPDNPIVFEVKSSAAGKPVSLGDAMKGLMDAFMAVQDRFRENAAGLEQYERPQELDQNFEGFGRQFIDEKGCLHLRDSKFTYPRNPREAHWNYYQGPDDW